MTQPSVHAQTSSSSTTPPSGVDEREGRGPYTVTLYRQLPSDTDGGVTDVERRAFPDLTKAQYHVDESIEDLGGSIDEWPDVPADGGRVGPLPWGSIKVELTTYEALITAPLAPAYTEADWARFAAAPSGAPFERAVLAAFNAAQPSSQAGEGR